MTGGRAPARPATAAIVPRRDPGEGLARDERLRRRADYLRCYRTGRRRGGPFATLHYAPNERGWPRLGITASRKVGGAVVRERLKRRVREIYRRWPGRRELPALDLVVHLKPAASSSSFDELAGQLRGQLAALVPRGER